MPGYSKSAFATPFGRNVFLRSTVAIKTVTHQVAAATVTARTIDGNTGQKVLQPGTVLAKITSGPYTGMVGPFQAAGTDEIQLITPSGTWSGGTYTLTVKGLTTAAIAYDANAATIQAALTAAGLATVANGGPAVTGGPLSSGAVTITFNGFNGVDEVLTTINTAAVTGTTPTAAVTTPTPGVAGATDGRQTLANIVGINNTFLPSQLMDRDVEVAVIYDASVVQANCIEYDAAGAVIALTNTTAAAMFGLKSLDIKFF